MSGQFAPVPSVPGIDPCPECLQGKHGNCDGSTWDIVADDFATCPCQRNNHDGIVTDPVKPLNIRKDTP